MVNVSRCRPRPKVEEGTASSSEFLFADSAAKEESLLGLPLVLVTLPVEPLARRGLTQVVVRGESVVVRVDGGELNV